MRRRFSAYGIAVSAIAILSIALVMLGCGSNSSSPKALTQAQAQSIATAVSNGMGQAVTGAFGVASLKPGANTVHNLEASPNVSTPVCLPSPSGEVCNWPIASTYTCPGGGSMALSGSITGILNTGGTGSAQAQIAATPASCSVDGIVLNGNPQVNLAAQINIMGDNPVWPLTGTETGGVTYGPNPSGSCTLNLTFTVNSSVACTVSGTACGHSVSGSC